MRAGESALTIIACLFFVSAMYNARREKRGGDAGRDHDRHG